MRTELVQLCSLDVVVVIVVTLLLDAPFQRETFQSRMVPVKALSAHLLKASQITKSSVRLSVQLAPLLIE